MSYFIFRRTSRCPAAALGLLAAVITGTTSIAWGIAGSERGTMASNFFALLIFVVALSACAPQPLPACHGSIVSLNAGQWQPTPADLQVSP